MLKSGDLKETEKCYSQCFLFSGMHVASPKEARSLTLLKRHLLDLFFHIHCQICFG